MGMKLGSQGVSGMLNFGGFRLGGSLVGGPDNGGPPASPTLNALTVSPSSGSVGVAFSGTVNNRTAGSTLSLSGAGSAGLSVNSSTGAITGTPTTAGAINVIETLAGATNTPRASNSLVTVSATVTLAALTVSVSSAMVNDIFNGTVQNRTAGSTLALSGAGSAGLSINSSTGVITGTPTTAGAVNVTETLAGATNTPRASNSVITVAALIPSVGVLAANRGQFPTNVALIPDDTVSVRDIWFSPEGDVTNPIIHHINTYINGSFALIIGSTAIFSAYLEYPLGTFTQLTFNGGSLTYSLGTGVVSSDPATGVTGLKGTKARVHTRLHSGGASIACIELPANADTIGVGDAKYAWAGAPAYPGAGQASPLFFGANAVTGTVAKTKARAFGIVGHSIPFGQGDITTSGVKGGSGGHAKGLDTRYPYVKIAKGGMDTSNMAALRTNGPLATFIKLCGLTDVIQDFTGGDLRNGTTVAAIKEAIQTVFGMFGDCRRFYLATATDRTDTTGDYNTGTQTPKTDGNWASQITLNTDIRAGLPRVTAVVDFCAITSTSLNSGIWPGGNRVLDGVHPTSFECDTVTAPYVAAFNFVIPAPGGAWVPSDLGIALTAAYDTNDVNQVTIDGSNNLVRMRASYGGGDILPGSSPDVSLVGGVANNKRVITFAAGEYLQSVDARILQAGSGVVASGKLTVIEAMKFVAGTTSRGFMLGTIGGVSGGPSIGIRQTTTNRGPSVTPVGGGTAYTAFQTAFDGNWHVHTVTVDGLNIVYYVDGVQVATGTIVGGTSYSFSQLLIGAVVGAVAGTPGSINPLSAHAGMLIADTVLAGADLTNANAWVGATAGL